MKTEKLIPNLYFFPEFLRIHTIFLFFCSSYLKITKVWTIFSIVDWVEWKHQNAHPLAQNGTSYSILWKNFHISNRFRITHI